MSVAARRSRPQGALPCEGARTALVVSGAVTAGIALVLLAIGIGVGVQQRDGDPERHAPAVLGRSRVSVSF